MNAAELKEYHREYRKKNRERLRAQMKTWKEENPTRVRELATKYREAHRAQQASWRDKNREKLRAYHSSPEQKARSKERHQAHRKSLVERPEHRAARLFYLAEYRETHREQIAAWREANRPLTKLKRLDPVKKERVRLKALAWRRANPEKVKARQKRQYYKHQEKHAARLLKWQKAHPEKLSLYNRRRKALKRGRVHPEIDRRIEQRITEECRRRTAETGVEHHVDHIIPLAWGGWHHHDNLQVLPGKLNSQKKTNPLWEVSGYKCWRDVPEFLWPEKLVPIYSNARCI